MSDKVLDLVEKIYIELQETRKELEDTRKELRTELKETRDELKNEIEQNSNHIMRLEEEFHDKIGILFDAQEQTNQRLERIENKLEDLSQKVDRHDIKIQVIEGGRNKKLV